MTSNEKKYELRCDFCGDEIYECDECDAELEDGDNIVCFDGGEKHFCSHDCLEDYIFNATEETTARSED